MTHDSKQTFSREMDRLPDKTMTPGTNLENHGRKYVAEKHFPLYANFPFVNGRCPFFSRNNYLYLKVFLLMPEFLTHKQTGEHMIHQSS